MKEKRLEWLDIARGIGIVLVVIGHAVTTDIRNSSIIAMAIYKLIYYFHMPFLVFLSGYAFKVSEDRYDKLKFREYLKNKLQKLMLPYVSFSIFVYITFLIANSLPGVSGILQGTEYEIIKLGDWVRGLLIGKNVYCVHLWYIYTLFIISIVTFGVKKITKYYKLLVLIIAVVLYFCSEYINYHGITILWRVCINYIWFALGLNLSITSKEKVTIKENAIICFSIVLLLMRVYMQWIKIDFIVEDIVDVIVCIMIIYSGIYCAQLVKGNIMKCLSYLGNNSFAIYLFQQPYFGSGVGMVLYGFLHLPILLVVIISVVLSIAVPFWVVRILKLPKMKIFKLMFLGK